MMLMRSLTLAVAGLLLCALPASAASYTVAVRDDYFRPRLLTEQAGGARFDLAACDSYDNGVVYLSYRRQT